MLTRSGYLHYCLNNMLKNNKFLLFFFYFFQMRSIINQGDCTSFKYCVLLHWAIIFVIKEIIYSIELPLTSWHPHPLPRPPSKKKKKKEKRANKQIILFWKIILWDIPQEKGKKRKKEEVEANKRTNISLILIKYVMRSFYETLPPPPL